MSDVFVPGGEQLIDVPVLAQLPELPNGCEVTSLTMLLAAGGVSVDKLTLADAQESDPTPPLFAPGKRGFYDIIRWGNPNESFVGPVRGYGGFGIFHAPLARLAETKARGRVLDLTGTGFSAVVDQVRQGHPVLVWTTVSQTPVTRWVTWQTPQGPFTGTSQEHAVVVLGFNARGLVINDPLSGSRKTVPAAPFITSWVQLGRQALTLSPADQPSDVS